MRPCYCQLKFRSAYRRSHILGAQSAAMRAGHFFYPQPQPNRGRAAPDDHWVGNQLCREDRRFPTGATTLTPERRSQCHGGITPPWCEPSTRTISCQITDFSHAEGLHGRIRLYRRGSDESPSTCFRPCVHNENAIPPAQHRGSAARQALDRLTGLADSPHLACVILCVCGAGSTAGTGDRHSMLPGSPCIADIRSC